MKPKCWLHCVAYVQHPGHKEHERWVRVVEDLGYLRTGEIFERGGVLWSVPAEGYHWMIETSDGDGFEQSDGTFLAQVPCADSRLVPLLPREVVAEQEAATA